jgi:hypothetical protein
MNECWTHRMAGTRVPLARRYACAMMAVLQAWCVFVLHRGCFTDEHGFDLCRWPRSCGG